MNDHRWAMTSRGVGYSHDSQRCRRAEPGLGLGHHVAPAGLCSRVRYARGATSSTSPLRGRRLARRAPPTPTSFRLQQRVAMKGKIMRAEARGARCRAVVQPARVSDDNPFPEALSRPAARDARRWVATFVAWHNDDHQHGGTRFVTPSERHDAPRTRAPRPASRAVAPAGGRDRTIVGQPTDHALRGSSDTRRYRGPKGTKGG
jgi:hypothetical protein